MKKTIIISTITALLVHFLCASPVLLVFVGWFLLGCFADYLWENLGGGHEGDFEQYLMCYGFPVITIPFIIICEREELYYKFPKFLRFRNPIYFKKEEE